MTPGSKPGCRGPGESQLIGTFGESLPVKLDRQQASGERAGVNVDDLLVGPSRWRMASLVVEPDGSVLMSVVPSGSLQSAPYVERRVVGGIRGIGAPHLAFVVRLPRRADCKEPCPLQSSPTTYCNR